MNTFLQIDNESIDRSQDVLWHWQAHLQLLLAHGKRGTTLNRCRHNGPLYVQKPFYPEGKSCAHIYLLHPPGGLVSGDTLAIDVQVEKDAHSVITTPGAARLYRARKDSPTQRQNIQIDIKENGILEWFPMETIVYDGAAAELTTTVQLTESSIYMGWEVTCLGLPASQQLMEQGYFQQRYQIIKDGLPVFIDRLHYDASQPTMFTNMAGMQNKTVSGFFIAGPFTNSDKAAHDDQQELLDSLREKLVDEKLESLFALTIMNGFFVGRYLGDSANQARDGFVLLWEILRPALIHKRAVHPRIWLT